MSKSQATRLNKTQSRRGKDELNSKLFVGFLNSWSQ